MAEREGATDAAIRNIICWPSGCGVAGDWFGLRAVIPNLGRPDLSTSEDTATSDSITLRIGNSNAVEVKTRCDIALSRSRCGADWHSIGGSGCSRERNRAVSKVDEIFIRLTQPREAVKRRCRTVLQAIADGLMGRTQANPLRPANEDFTPASVQLLQD